ncbi:MAG: DoxX-like family protein [Ramlibacter sp.]
MSRAQDALARILQLCSWTVGGIWIYQGLVPKLLGPHADEIAMSTAFGIPASMQAPISYAAGAAEIVFGLLVLVFSQRAWPHILSATAMAVLLIFVALYAPHFLAGAFNPVVMNIASLSLSLAALLAYRGM